MRHPGPLVLVVALACLSGASAEDGSDLMYEPVFREGRAADVLVDGDPPLRREHLDAFVEFTEAAFDLAIPARLEQDLRDELETGFGASGKERRQAFLDAVKPWPLVKDRASRGDTEAVRDAFAAFRREIDLRLRDMPRARASTILGEVLVMRQETVWPGTPPIHAIAAAAWLEIAQFLASLGRNEEVTPTDGQVTALRQSANGCLNDREIRERVLRAHRAWLATKVRWTEADAAKRFKMRWEAVALVARVLPPGRQHAVRTGPELTDYAREASAVSVGQSGYDAMVQIARNPAFVFTALERGLGVPKDSTDSVIPCR